MSLGLKHIEFIDTTNKRLLWSTVVIHVSIGIYRRQFSSHGQLFERYPDDIHLTTLLLQFLLGIDSV